MKCPNCGKKIPYDSNFCEFCGTRLTDSIPNHTIIWLLVVIIGIGGGVGVLWYLNNTQESATPISETFVHPHETTTQDTKEETQKAPNDKPEFPGGQQALFKYINDHIEYPASARKKGVQGCVICQFYVKMDGSIVDVKVVSSCGDPSMDKEAVRVIKSMPKWKPAKQKNKKVRFKYTIPVNFKL